MADDTAPLNQSLREALAGLTLSQFLAERGSAFAAGTEPLTIPADFTVGEALEKLARAGISSAPVRPTFQSVHLRRAPLHPMPPATHLAQHRCSGGFAAARDPPAR